MIDELEEQGWIYGDLPRLTEEYFDKFVEIVGEENLKWLTIAQYPAGFQGSDEVLIRGQYMMSPEGVSRVKEYDFNKL